MKEITASKKVIFQVASLVTVGISLLLFTSFSFLALTGTLFTLFILNSLLLNLGEGIPIHIIIIFLASIQWIIGPILSYYTGINHPFYGMQVSESDYFSLALPGVILYYFGLSIPVTSLKDKSKLIIGNLEVVATDKKKVAYYLIGLGFLATFITPFLPISLYFFLYLISQLKFIGCFYLYVSNFRSNTILIIVVFSLLLNAVVTAMFHDLVLWGMFFLFIYSIKNKVSLIKRVSFLIVGFFMLILLQSVKYQYRSVAWNSTSLDTTGKADVFLSMISENLWSPDRMFDAKKNELAVTRLNQGWIITRVMNYVPAVQPFANGETIKDAFSAALLPRFISEDKAQAGGRFKMERFTGIILQEGTSMNISLLGEGYGNYGKGGAIFFMFCIGILYSLILRFVLLKSLDNATFIFWIPFLFLQVIKAETDLLTTLNYLVKALIVMMLIYYGFRKFLKLEI